LEVSGRIQDVTWYEIAVLQVVQEEWSRWNGWLFDPDIVEEGRKRLREKVIEFNKMPLGKCKIIEMGTRRAFSESWHREVVTYLAKNLKNFAGTSNIGLAQELGVPCKGTMAHEYLQMGQVLAPNLRCTNDFMLRAWHDIFQGRFGIALSDVLGTKVFFREFQKELATWFDGTRQDSGVAKEYGFNMMNHYDSLDISAKTKDICFSDSLGLANSFDLVDTFYQDYRTVILGIGTFFSNDMGVDALKIVMKMTTFNGKPVAKIADGGGAKMMCKDNNYVELLKKANDIE